MVFQITTTAAAVLTTFSLKATMLIGGLKVLLQGRVLRARFLQLVNRNAIWHCLDETAVLARRYDVERSEPEFQAVQVKDVFELGDHL